MGDVADVATADGLVVTGEFFRTLGVSARLGRTFSDMDEAGAAVAVLSHGLWERRFGASETVIGTSVTLNDKPHEVVGVMPRDFELRMLDQSAYARNTADFDVLVALPQADNTRTVRLTLVVVAGAVGCLLLIACMNIATLWLGRSSGRAREAAIRVALGSGRMRLVRQFLAESLLMTCIGGACGRAHSRFPGAVQCVGKDGL